MPHVSKHQLEQKVFEEIAREFFLTLATPRKTRPLSELLTRTEKVMLAKRLAIISLLLQKKSVSATARYLKVSPMTPLRIERALKAGRYRTLSTLLKDRLHSKTFLGFIEKLITPGLMPHRQFQNFLDEIS